MNKKKWLSALLIIGVLALAYFWGGNYAENSSSETAIATAPVSAEEPAAVASATESEAEPSLSGEQAESVESVDAPSNESPANEMTSPDQAPSDTVEQPSTMETDTGNGDQTTKPSDGPKASAAPSATVKPSGDGDGPGKGTASAPATASKPPATAPDGKDQYQTEPVPSGKPKPVEWQDVEVDKSKSLTVTLSVSAATILNHLDSFNEDKLEVLPKDGIIYKAQKVAFYEGESVFDVLLREMKKNKIHMEFEMTPIYNSNYIEGIHNIYEFDCGELSGWMYKVNGWFPNYGASRYALKDGDVVEWVYTCDLGRDVGGYNVGAGDKS